jgi:predicted dehydrogenase
MFIISCQKNRYSVERNILKQILQNLRNGETQVAHVPVPGLTKNHLLIQTRASLISAGTERMLVEFGKAGLIAKAKSQPDKVKQVLDKIKADGLLPTLEAVFNRLDEPLPLGYCNAGVVLDVGSGVTEFQQGDRVVSNGPHAEIVTVPKTLCAKIPENVPDEQAAFTVLASVGLQGIRLLKPCIGDRVAVFGLGLVGLITAQLLRANGCSVIGIDLNQDRLALAEEFGIVTVHGGSSDPVTAARRWTDDNGVDGVLVTTATDSNEVMHQAAEMSRKRGNIIMTGKAGMHLRHSDFFEKELSFQLSCSYGPGRYDETYEEKGQDYPFAFVRWTEQRNMQAVLDALSSNSLDVGKLITHQYTLDQAPEAYGEITSDSKALAVILTYKKEVSRKRVIEFPQHISKPGKPVIGIIGAGNYTKVTLMPALRKTDAELAWVANLKGTGSAHLAAKFNIAKATTDYTEILADSTVQAVIITVRNHLHARFATEALQAGKHVLLEKPMALDTAQLSDLLEAYRKTKNQHLIIGFNRRFSPHIVKIKKLLVGRNEPLAMSMTVNAGIIPQDNWNHDPAVGGGRIIAESCHFIDLMSHLAESPVLNVSAVQFGSRSAVLNDKVTIQLDFEDGSIGAINYFSNGSKSYPKEKMEIFCEGKILHLDNFRCTRGYGIEGFKKYKTFRQEKGHREEVNAFVRLINAGGEPLISMKEQVNATLASFAAVISANERRIVNLADEYQHIIESLLLCELR